MKQSSIVELIESDLSTEIMEKLTLWKRCDKIDVTNKKTAAFRC